MTKQAPTDQLVEQLLTARDMDAQSVCARFERLSANDIKIEERASGQVYTRLIDYLRSLPAPGIKGQEQVGRMLYSLNHGYPWAPGVGEDGSLFDLFERDLDGVHGYGWANAIARGKPYMVFEAADMVFDAAKMMTFGIATDEEHLAEHLDHYLGSRACWPSVRGRVAALGLRQLHQFLDDPILYSSHRTEVPRQSQRSYINRLVKCRLSEGMLRVGSQKTRDTLWVLNALAPNMTEGQAKRWARKPIIRPIETMQRKGCSYLDQLRAHLVRQSLVKTSRAKRKPTPGSQARGPRM